MCVTCGCSDNSQVTVTSLKNGKTNHSHTHTLADGTVINHTHEQDHYILRGELNSSELAIV